MKDYLRGYLVLIGTAGMVVGLDQWTKWLVRENLPFQGTWLPDWLFWLRPYARIVHWNNSGAAFGMFQGASDFFTILAILVIAAILYYYPRVEPGDWFLRLAMGLQLGGAAGNLIDRLTREGKVTDFISVGTFPVFNIADASISAGVAVLLLSVWLKEQYEKKTASRNNEMTGNPIDK